ncbi:hypothetical protein JOF56_006427 [Kibdelosporangium banguiense]|uniref:Tetratricopeptide repeat protein n=1 Tax=Kibdelosporangium banguiense TaxID=1365924 RepID=A0ABS4TNQ2_9PSEU|nr:tetratricopeptide repeat protein [Kibdelosporangium banguiense]MBP2326042.1 hypothetical protein [Kibdelosporangium banguiense]
MNQFLIANRLWFREGRTAKALARYTEATQAQPNNPVVAFQVARVLWAFDRFGEARAALARADANRARLSDIGRLALDQRLTLTEYPPARHYPDLPPDRLDRDLLGAAADWRRVAQAADDREMGGLAVYALERWNGVPLDAEDARYLGRITTNRDLEEALLTQMPASPPQELPLRLEVRVIPEKGRLGEPTQITAILHNPTDKPIAVNRRMLLNRPGRPGEVWLDLRGPAGYRNSAGVRINAGSAPAEFFVTLAPGESTEKSWDLARYATTETAGNYEITLTYHNEAGRSPDGNPMAVGKVSGRATFERHS